MYHTNNSSQNPASPIEAIINKILQKIGRILSHGIIAIFVFSVILLVSFSPVAWFCLDPASAHKDMLLSDDHMTVTCDSYDDRVILGSVGFSRGVHYWEITIDKYENDTDPTFGVALRDVGKDHRLGK